MTALATKVEEKPPAAPERSGTDADRPATGRRRPYASRQPLAIILLAALALLTFLPIGMLVVGSFRDAPPGAPGGWTLDGWVEAYTDPRTYSTLFVTVLITLAALLVATPLALLLAWVVTRTDTPGRGVLERLLLVPLFVPGVLLALAWTVLGSPRTGYFNEVVRLVPGMQWFTFDIYSAYGLVFIFALAMTPLMYFMLLPVLKGMDHTLEEAATAAGAGRLGTALRVSLPLAAPAIIGGGILMAIKAVENLEVPAMLRSGSGIDVFMTRIFFSIRTNPQPDYAQAAALGATIVAFTALLVILQLRYVGRRDFTTIGARGGKTEVVRLGGWRWVTAGLCWGYLLLAVVAPMVILVLGSFERVFGLGRLDQLTFAHWQASMDSDNFWAAVENTIVTAGASALLVAVLSAAVAYVIVRSTGPTKWALEGMSWVPWSLPGLVLGLGLLWAYALLPGQLYLTRWVLVLAYTTILLPLGVRLFISAFRQLDVQLEEAAEVSGSGRLRLIGAIIAPLISRTVTASLVLGFVLSVREVAVPAVLASRDNQVLGSLTLNLWLEGRASQAAVAGVMMVVLCLLALLLQALVDFVVVRRQDRDSVVAPRINVWAGRRR